ncbi:TBC1 domain family member 22B isoform X1 [Ictalurus punctatus]|uniref:TBC1 domain family member 22B isoform X1 n=1 Tax=Ictalurus punctatus TaxID=7998 RepID=A0A2D0R1H5_ICTPU|nr:TBC1 domain family member 22B isoform X1 [Ictalurus punctatus]
MAADNKIHFWRRNAKGPGSLQPIYGARYPPVDPRVLCSFLKDTPKSNAVSVKSKKPSTFHEFARSTNDAWDIDDVEDSGFFTPTHSVPVQSHSTVKAPRLKETNRVMDKEPEPRPGDRLEAGSREVCRDQLRSDSESVNGRVVKSSSDVQLNSNSERSTLQKQQSLPMRPIIPLVARISDQNASGAPPMTVREKTRLDKFRLLLASPNTDLEDLRKHSWSGIPREMRPITWRLLSGYLPANMERRELVLQRKREEYFGFIEQYYHSRTDEHHRDTYRQIHIDIPRTNPLIPLFQQPLVQEVFERILFIWAIRHPASGYVQGINDLVTPFFVVFLSEFVEEDMENFEMAALPLETQRNIEADSFWCMSKLLDGIQDNYTFAQPGIQKKVKALEELISRIDEDVHLHFQKCEVEYLQFAFRWMNNLLMRELPLRCTIRLWDTYQAESEGFSHFHLYVCAAFLIKWRKEILSMLDFQGLLMLLQNLPTIHWGNEEVGLLLAEAYRLKYMFADAPRHYKR